MEKSKIERIAVLVAMQKQINAEIDAFKEECRHLTKEEINAINEVGNLHIKQEDKPITTRDKKYDIELAILKEAYPTITTYEENGKITLTTSNLAINKAEIIVQNVATLAKTKLQELTK